MSLFKLSAVDIVKFLKEGKYTCEEVIKSFIEQMTQKVGFFLITKETHLIWLIHLFTQIELMVIMDYLILRLIFYLMGSK